VSVSARVVPLERPLGKPGEVGSRAVFGGGGATIVLFSSSTYDVNLQLFLPSHSTNASIQAIRMSYMRLHNAISDA